MLPPPFAGGGRPGPSERHECRQNRGLQGFASWREGLLVSTANPYIRWAAVQPTKERHPFGVAITGAQEPAVTPEPPFIRWARKVQCDHISGHYEADAAGLRDEALVDDAGCTFAV